MQLMPKPAPGFDDPLGLLRACHERILGHCDTLERLESHLRQHGADQDAQEARQSILTTLNFYRLSDILVNQSALPSL